MQQQQQHAPKQKPNPTRSPPIVTTHQQLLEVHQDAAAHGPLPLPVVLRSRKNRENLRPLTQGNPLRVRLVCPHDVAQVTLRQKIVDSLGSEANRAPPPQAFSEARAPNRSLLTNKIKNKQAKKSTPQYIEGGKNYRDVSFGSLYITD